MWIWCPALIMHQTSGHSYLGGKEVGWKHTSRLLCGVLGLHTYTVFTHTRQRGWLTGFAPLCTPLLWAVRLHREHSPSGTGGGGAEQGLGHSCPWRGEKVSLSPGLKSRLPTCLPKIKKIHILQYKLCQNQWQYLQLLFPSFYCCIFRLVQNSGGRRVLFTEPFWTFNSEWGCRGPDS